MVKPKYKYRINELLNSLSVKDFKKAIRVIPIELKISVPTFNNYRSIKIEDIQDIPHEKVVMLEKILDIGPGELANYSLTTRPLSEICDTEGGSYIV